MQENRRSNPERSAATRDALVSAGRELFLTKGYAATGTPEVVARAGVTRGALYHHFRDKLALFEAVVAEEWAAVAAAIDAGGGPAHPLADLIEGARRYMAAMSDPHRVSLLLIDAPNVLGWARARSLDTARLALLQGLRAALGESDTDVVLLGEALSSAFDRAALGVSDGEDGEAWMRALRRLLEQLAPEADSDLTT
ncbi:MAG: TetR/AcrR family transcriptional regulator [Brevundimonas sp.]